MLIKLLKYDFKAIARNLLPQYLGLLLLCFFGTLAAKYGDVGNKILEFIFPFIVAVGTMLTVSIMISTVSFVCKRWTNTVYENEAYFVQVLPISTAEFVIEKMILAAIFGVIGAVVLITAALIPALLSVSAQELFDFVGRIIDFKEGWRYLFQFLLSAGIYVMNLLMCFSFSSALCAAIAKRNQWLVAIVFVALILLTNYLSTLLFNGFSYLRLNSDMGFVIIYGFVQSLVYALGTWYFLEKHYNL